MSFIYKVGSALKSCVSASADFAGEQTMKLLKSQYPDIKDVMVVLDQVKDRVKVRKKFWIFILLSFYSILVACR